MYIDSRLTQLEELISKNDNNRDYYEVEYKLIEMLNDQIIEKRMQSKNNLQRFINDYQEIIIEKKNNISKATHIHISEYKRIHKNKIGRETEKNLRDVYVFLNSCEELFTYYRENQMQYPAYLNIDANEATDTAKTPEKKFFGLF